MALSVEVVKSLENGRVQIDARNKIFGNELVSSYSVPKSKSDEFIADYKKEAKKRNLFGVLGGAITGGMFLMGLAASKHSNVILKVASTVLFTAVGLVGSALGIGIGNARRLSNIFKKNDVVPIIYLHKHGPIKDAENKIENK